MLIHKCNSESSLVRVFEIFKVSAFWSVLLLLLRSHLKDYTTPSCSPFQERLSCLTIMAVTEWVVKGISGAIGISSEIIAHHKQKKSVKQMLLESTSPDDSPASNRDLSQPLAYPNAHTASCTYQSCQLSDAEEVESLNTDQARWVLDETSSAVEEGSTRSRGQNETISSSDGPSFQTSQLLDFTSSHSRIPLPIILPQRRPNDKSRGFIRAYPPSLGEYAGIDEASFLKFLSDFDRAIKTSPIYDVINLACFGAGFSQEPITANVALVVQLASDIAKDIHERYKRNSFLDKANDTIFKPRGLFCMIMTFKPDNPYTPILDIDVSSKSDSTTMALSQVLSDDKSFLSKKMQFLRTNSGVTVGEVALPESAPLIFPALDRAIRTDQEIPDDKRNVITRSSSFLNAYMDRRAQAKYAAMHPESKLNSLPPAQFASRFSDPNHPVNSGGIVALISGGRYNPIGNSRMKRAQRQATKHGVKLNETHLKNAAMGRAPRKERNKFFSIMQSNVLYLTIVNMPSETELEEARLEIKRMKQQK